MYKILSESYSIDLRKHYNILLRDYNKIFPNRANRNAAGFKFFSYIYDHLAKNEELFDAYNTMYCAVSGSVVQPGGNNFSVLKVNNKNGECVYGKYYRCCVPCNCDIMKYVTVEKCKIELPKQSGNFIDKQLLTIGDPCIHENKIPSEVDKNIFKCNSNLLEHGYRVKDGMLTKGQGRLVIGVLYPVLARDMNKLEQSVGMCTTGNKRFYQEPNKLKYGMGDIFVNLALINNNKKYSHTDKDFCKN